MAETKTIKTVEKSFEIVEALQNLQPAGVSAVAADVDVPVSTAYMHLNTLRQRGYVVKTADDYRLSLRFLEHGGSVRQQLDYFSIVKDEVNQLKYITGEIAGFAVEQRGKRVVLYRSEGSSAVGDQIPIGEHTYLHWTSLGKAILANLPSERIDEIIDTHELPASTNHTITNKDELRGELERIRTVGYAVDDAERRRGIRGIAVPVVDANEDIIGSIGVAGPKVRFNEHRLAELLDILREKRNVIEVRNDFYR